MPPDATPSAGTSRAAPRPARIGLAGAQGWLRPSGAFWWPGERLLCVADLHLGRAGRMARLGGSLLPPYETGDTLERLADEIATLAPRIVVCLGDSFDDTRAAEESEAEIAFRLEGLAAGRDWVWIAGNHDPDPAGHPGRWTETLERGPLVFRHAALPEPPAEGRAELSGHYHPKARVTHRGRRITRRCFLSDGSRLILPAFGTYTGGLDARDPAFDPLLGKEAQAHLLGPAVVTLPRTGLG